MNQMFSNNKMLKETIEWIESIVLSVFIIVLVFTFFIRFVGVSGTSMLNTFQNGDRLIIQKIGYTPKVGDVVVLSRSYLPLDNPDSTEPIIKRIIALGGQKVEIKSSTGEVFVDGKLLHEDYVEGTTTVVEGGMLLDSYVVEVPEGHLFVMGDNREVSKDSRNPAVGTIDEHYVLGKAILRVFPFESFATSKEW